MKPWVVVKHAGCANEEIVCEGASFDDISCALAEQFPSESERAELGADIMKRLPNGELTSEY